MKMQAVKIDYVMARLMTRAATLETETETETDRGKKSTSSITLIAGELFHM